MKEKVKRRHAKGGVVVSQEYYDSLSDVQKESGRFIVDDSSPLEELAGATLLAKKAGFKGTCLTPFVYEYQMLRDTGQLDDV
jgi:predicted aconitase with swiveling domain